MASLGLSIHPCEWLDATGGTGDILTTAIDGMKFANPDDIPVFRADPNLRGLHTKVPKPLDIPLQPDTIVP